MTFSLKPKRLQYYRRFRGDEKFSAFHSFPPPFPIPLTSTPFFGSEFELSAENTFCGTKQKKCALATVPDKRRPFGDINTWLCQGRSSQTNRYASLRNIERFESNYWMMTWK
ncbi:hypothetical protein NPIL_542721 [Nephila pilipes]|uniref:Uncharacterized protein n=1 Tax=Nephila pilipes TaxID=299642 RepID=A0A8X6R432_NEPPI|nr:hypothetical protein NPIL_389491 [Nephila pilipes]GFU59761.1 hypothetical protein NPIL_542721 [Nephila pilipes]